MNLSSEKVSIRNYKVLKMAQPIISEMQVQRGGRAVTFLGSLIPLNWVNQPVLIL